MFLSFIYPHLLWFLLLAPLTVALALLGTRRPTVGRFWFGLALRVLLLTLIVFALAGLQIRRLTDTLTVVFVLDVSDSIPKEQQAYGESLIRQAVERMPAGDQAAVVVFGQDALVERIAAADPSLPRFTSMPLTARTDIASALQLGLALFPDEGGRRLVLLSDGRENVGQAIAQAELAAAHQIELSYIPLGGPQSDVEVLIESLDAPADVRQGQSLDLTVAVRSTAQVNASLRIFGDGQLIHTREVLLQEGVNRFQLPVGADRPGFRRFRAQIVPDVDTRLQNNEASAFTVVHGPPHVLLVEGSTGEGENLARALRAAEMGVTVILPSDLPVTLPELSSFDAVILVNVPAAALPSGEMELLQTYVRDLGHGLLMVGGVNSLGAGGYLRTSLEKALPVDMDVRDKEQSPNLAVALVIDKSGSMGRCHCNNPDAKPGEYDPIESGQTKVDIAKEAIMRAAAALGPQDHLGVVAFDDKAHWVVELGLLIDPLSLEQAIGGIPAHGQSNMRAGVEAAYQALQGVAARYKHIILLTDGWVREGELTGLAAQMRQQGITLSVVAAGEGTPHYLQELAEAGGGRHYLAVNVLEVPDFFLQETVKAVGRYIIEESFYPLPGMPGPILRDLDVAVLPLLHGYNGATPKGMARVLLSTPRGDPLLATWQYGLGKSVVWTSDLKDQWAGDWLIWDGFGRFAAQMVGWMLPAPQVEGLSAQAVWEQGQAVLRAQTADQAGAPRNFLVISATVIGPDLEAHTVSLPQVGAGRYETRLDLDEPGAYLVRIEASDGGESLGQQTYGLVAPYSPEYAAAGSGVHYALLEALSGRAGGQAWPDLFAHDAPLMARTRPVWQWLLLLTALLFPLDVAVRRVILGPGDVRRAWAWLRARLSRPRRQATGARTLSPLFQARERARAQARHRRQPASPAEPPPVEPSPAHRPDAPSPPNPKIAQPPEEGDALTRLRQAKKRAQRR